MICPWTQEDDRVRDRMREALEISSAPAPEGVRQLCFPVLADWRGATFVAVLVSRGDIGEPMTLAEVCGAFDALWPKLKILVSNTHVGDVVAIEMALRDLRGVLRLASLPSSAHYAYVEAWEKVNGPAALEPGQTLAGIDTDRLRRVFDNATRAQRVKVEMEFADGVKHTSYIDSNKRCQRARTLGRMVEAVILKSGATLDAAEVQAIGPCMAPGVCEVCGIGVDRIIEKATGESDGRVYVEAWQEREERYLQYRAFVDNAVIKADAPK